MTYLLRTSYLGDLIITNPILFYFVEFCASRYTLWKGLFFSAWVSCLNYYIGQTDDLKVKQAVYSIIGNSENWDLSQVS